MKKLYIEPKIKAVILDPEQAILQVCITGGVLMALTTACMGSMATGFTTTQSCTQGRNFTAATTYKYGELHYTAS